MVLHSLNRNFCFLIFSRLLLIRVFHRAMVTFDLPNVLCRMGVRAIVGEDID